MQDIYQNKLRSDEFRKDKSLEETLAEINKAIKDVSIEHETYPQLPIVLIVGNARSGSTLVLQYLASTSSFSYPSNLISRFYANPWMGIKIQQVLHDLVAQKDLTFDSKLGRTEGLLSPSEYWYFWRQFYKFGQINKLSEKELATVNYEKYLKGLGAFDALLKKPLVMKGLIMNWNLDFLHKIYPKFIFLHLSRNILENAKSLFQARRKFFNNEENWYSFKPPEYESLKTKSPIEQVVGQVYFTNKAINDQLDKIPKKNKIGITYEDFCNCPVDLYKMINSKMKEFGVDLTPTSIDSSLTFKSKSVATFSQKEENLFKEALKHYD